MKQKIIFYAFTNEALLYECKDDIEIFCNKNGYILKWQIDHWSIGIFEQDHYNDEIEKIINFGLQYFANPPKVSTTSINDTLAKKLLINILKSLLDVFNCELKLDRYRIRKRFPSIDVNHICSEEEIEEIETKYRYKFTDNDKEVIRDTISRYINSYRYLKEYFYY